MFVSWSLWVYLVMPLISLLVWIAASYLFKKEMLSPGGLETLQNIAHYGTLILVMWAMMAVWIVWNQKRYGRRNRRHGKAPVVTNEQIRERTQLSNEEVDYLRNTKEVYLHYDEEDYPVIDQNVESLDRHIKVAAV
ncbi:MAG: poly-beta-1,6-N-acetyl-D-glucosamine biosynthesis protein PgaD [Gammaproteobacteria bacterium]|nr:poly-beta-1,6-N-acetyl-D-glucosamine biosynthesis protein PgaD [Gammaproteobacteria bacterium]